MADAPTEHVYNVRVPKIIGKQHNLMRFNGALKVDFSKWSNVKMIREDNSALHKLPEWGTTDMPKFGAGSEYGREQREEARRRKYGSNAKKYKPQDQPWILKVGSGETSKKFKGVREGGVNDNASYFIFTQAQDGCFEVFPIKEWFNFTPIQRYKSLTAEEAEEQFSKRNKIMNLFSVMVQKRLKDDKEEADEDSHGRAEKSSKRDKSDMKLTDMEDWVVDDDIGDEDDSDDEGNKKDSKNKKQKGKPKKKKGKESDEDPLEDSDDGDEEGREQDYMTDVSSSSEDEEQKKPDLPGVDQDDALRALLESGSSSEDEESKSEEKKEEEQVEGEKKKKSKKKKKHDMKEEAKSPDAPMLASDHDMAGEDAFDAKPEVAVEPKTEVSTKDEVGALKRKAVNDMLGNSSKKHKVEVPPSTLQLAASEGITEEAVRKYLQRKPMTIAELLQKFKPKKSKISSNDLVPVIAHILKKISPSKRNQQNKMYFFINPQ